MTTDEPKAEIDYSRYIGVTAEPRLSPPLDIQLLRQFILAVMDQNRLYYDAEAAKAGPYGEIVAPPLFPIHMFRLQPDGPDSLAPLQGNAELDGTGGLDSILFGLPKIDSPLTRLINGGNEVEFYRHLRLGERVRATARYSDVRFRQSSKGPMLIATIETRFETEDGHLLLTNRTTSINR